MTVNEMIYVTLTTKQDKIPKYKEALEAMGYILNNTHDSSSYDYWGIVLSSDPKHRSILVISKSYYTGKRKLFGNMGPIETYDIKKVDFVNLIKIHQKRERFENMRFRYSWDGSNAKIKKYKQLVEEYKRQNSAVKYDEEKLKKLEEDTAKEIEFRKQMLTISRQRQAQATTELLSWKAENLTKTK